VTYVPSGPQRQDRSRESGYALAALIVTISVMMLAMSAAAPTWRYIVKGDKEEELIFRGNQIADAIQRFQAKNGNAVPPSLEVLVKGKFLRKVFKDPMTKDGEWRLVRQGEMVGAPGAGPGSTGPGGKPARGLSPTTRGVGRPLQRSTFGAGQVLGGIVGVASKSEEEGLRLYNGRSKYSEWVFGPGQPRVVGNRPIGPAVPAVIQPGMGPQGPGGRPGFGPQRPGQLPRTPGRPQPRPGGGTG
jgi:type II secretory pathway pseudopilin PulG